MEERQRRGDPRHAAVVAADMEQRRGAAARDQAAEHEGIVTLGRAAEREPSGGRRCAPAKKVSRSVMPAWVRT